MYSKKIYASLAVLLSLAAPAVAGEIRACGVPTPANMKATPMENSYCDIHQRTFGYREESFEHTKALKERQQNYVAPQIEAVNRYKADIDSLNASRGGASSETAQATSEDAELERMLEAEEEAAKALEKTSEKTPETSPEKPL